MKKVTCSGMWPFLFAPAFLSLPFANFLL